MRPIGMAASSFCIRAGSFMVTRLMDVATAEGPDGGADQLLQVRHLADVGEDADGLVAERGDLLLQLLGGLRMDDVVDDDVGALPGQLQYHGLADATVASGDDGDFSLQRHDGSPSRPRTTTRASAAVASATTAVAPNTATPQPV